MVLFFTVTLAVSLVAMIAMLALKRYELSSGRVVLAGARPGVNSFFRSSLHWLNQELPALLQRRVRGGWSYVRTQTQRALAYCVVTFERSLESVLRAVRERTGGAQPGGEPSAFLREVADHKRTLLYKKSFRRRVLKDSSVLKEPEPRDTVQE